MVQLPLIFRQTCGKSLTSAWVLTAFLLQENYNSWLQLPASDSLLPPEDIFIIFSICSVRFVSSAVISIKIPPAFPVHSALTFSFQSDLSSHCSVSASSCPAHNRQRIHPEKCLPPYVQSTAPLLQINPLNSHFFFFHYIICLIFIDCMICHLPISSWHMISSTLALTVPSFTLICNCSPFETCETLFKPFCRLSEHMHIHVTIVSMAKYHRNAGLTSEVVLILI